MSIPYNFRKWWHIILDIEDRNMSLLTSFTTIDENNPNSNADSSITARLIDCGSTLSIPPRAWDYSESPGYFIFRPDLTSLSSAMKEVSSYNDVINVDNKRVFKYYLKAAYNELDNSCSAIVPTAIYPSEASSLTDSAKSIVFTMSEIPFITEAGCCDLGDIEIPDPLPDPETISDCSRLWYIVDETSGSHLYSFDILTEEIIDRGMITWPYGENTDLYYHDLAWDNRNFLWGLDSNGITRILIGDSSVNAYALNYSTVTNSFSDTEELFPIIYPEDQGYGAMAFNQHNNKMYIFANRRLWEMQPVSNNEWEVTKISYAFGENESLSDLAFGTNGKCYCIYNNKLAEVAFDDTNNLPFGYITYINTEIDYSNFIGLDFIYSSDYVLNSELYGIKTTGQIFSIDIETGNKILFSGTGISDIAVGMSSCQAGEDLRTLPFPFFPGKSPWLFIIDSSNKISGESMSKIKDTMNEFISNYIRKGDYFSVLSYGDSLSSFGPRIMNNYNDVEDAVDFIDSLKSSGSPNFCNAFIEASNVAKYNNLESIVVISDGHFSDCGDTSNEIENNLLDNYTNIKNNNSQVTLYSVGINPTNESYLKYLGNIGGGGYVKWT